MAHLVLTDKTVLERCRGALEHAPAKDEADFIRRATRDPHLRHMAFPMGSWAARALKEDGVIRQSGNEWHIDESRANAVKVFCAYVRLDFRSDNHDPVAG
jgi:hypothetical protein